MWRCDNCTMPNKAVTVLLLILDSLVLINDKNAITRLIMALNKKRGNTMSDKNYVVYWKNEKTGETGNMAGYYSEETATKLCEKLNARDDGYYYYYCRIDKV